MTTQSGSILLGMILMGLLSLFLFWLPLMGPLIAGGVGGYVAGSAGRGLLAAIFPGIALAVLLLVFGTALTGVPLIGMLAGGGVFLLVAVQSIPLIVGAIVGGLLS